MTRKEIFYPESFSGDYMASTEKKEGETPYKHGTHEVIIQRGLHICLRERMIGDPF